MNGGVVKYKVLQVLNFVFSRGTSNFPLNLTDEFSTIVPLLNGTCLRKKYLKSFNEYLKTLLNDLKALANSV